MLRNSHPRVTRYILALGIVALSAAASVRLSAAMAVPASLIVFFPAVILSLFLGGPGPGLLATALSAMAGVVLIIWPDGRLQTDEILTLVIFTLASVLSCRMMAAREKHVETEIDLLGTAMASAVEGVARLAEDGVLVSFNASFATTVGQPDDAIATHSILNLVYSPDRTLVTAALRQSRQTGRAEVEVRLLGQDSTQVNVNLMFVRLSAMGDSPRGHYCFIRDISRRKTDEAQLKQSLDRFQGAFRHSHTGMAIVSPDGCLLDVNPAACLITGYTESELKARTFESITHNDDLKVDLDMLRRLRNGEFNHYRVNKRYVGRRGEPIRVQVSVTMVRDSSGRPLYCVVQMQDLAAPDTQAIIPMAAPAPPAPGV